MDDLTFESSPQFLKILFDLKRLNFKSLVILDTSDAVRRSLEPSNPSDDEIAAIFSKNRRVFFRIETVWKSCVGIGIVRGVGRGQSFASSHSILIEPLEVDHTKPIDIFCDENRYSVFCVDLKTVNPVSLAEEICVVPLL